MALDLASRQLLHSGTATVFSSTSGRPVISGFNVIREFMSITEQLLAQVPRDHGCRQSDEVSPARCAVLHSDDGSADQDASKTFDTREAEDCATILPTDVAAGNCRRSSSQWSSGLHMVPKKDGTW